MWSSIKNLTTQKFNPCTTNKARHLYHNRVVCLWNKLPDINLENSFSKIKAYLSKILWNYILHSFDPENICSYTIFVVHVPPAFNLTVFYLYIYLLMLINQIHLEWCYSVQGSVYSGGRGTGGGFPPQNVGLL